MNKINIGITMGDPAGVGPEVLVKAISHLYKKRLSLIYSIIGDKYVLEKNIKKLGLRNFLGEKEIKLFDLKNVSKNYKPGKLSPEYGRASLEYIDTAIRLLKKKEISALVTGPVSKSAINMFGKNFFGHSEYLASHFKVKRYQMMLTNRYMRVVPLTRHIPFQEISPYLNFRFVYIGIKMVLFFLKKYFQISSPRLAVCSLNPHSGEEGFVGKEEKRVILPVIERLKEEGNLQIYGPFSADGLFSRYRRGDYDCIVGMYHDQVMIPVKMVDPEYTVNITLGLPFIRTSVGHGTAFDIARKGIASPNSMIEAIKIAYQLARHVHSH